MQLPNGLTCDGKKNRCVLQWYWLTANSCNAPDQHPKFITPGPQTCGEAGVPYPEEFWNCANIVIQPQGSRGPQSVNSQRGGESASTSQSPVCFN